MRGLGSGAGTVFTDRSDRVLSGTGVCDMLSKSCGRRPSGSDGGAMRWRLGVEGALPMFSLIESRVSSSLIDLRRLFAPHDGFCIIWRGVLGANFLALDGFALGLFATRGFSPVFIVGLGRSVDAQRARNGECERFEERRS